MGQAMNGLDDIRPQLERCGSLMFTAAIIFMVLYAAGIVLVLNTGVIEGDSRQDDFGAFWAAAWSRSPLTAGLRGMGYFCQRTS